MNALSWIADHWGAILTTIVLIIGHVLFVSNLVYQIRDLRKEIRAITKTLTHHMESKGLHQSASLEARITSLEKGK